MARPRSYHQDRAMTDAERARAYRKRQRLRNETSPHPQRHETPDRHETRVTKSVAPADRRPRAPSETGPSRELASASRPSVKPGLRAAALVSASVATPSTPSRPKPRGPVGDFARRLEELAPLDARLGEQMRKAGKRYRRRTEEHRDGLVSLVDAGLDQPQKPKLRVVIETILERLPALYGNSFEGLRSVYFREKRASKAAAPTDEAMAASLIDKWMRMLEQWQTPRDEAFSLIRRLLVAAGGPDRGPKYVDDLFELIAKTPNRARRQKAKWLRDKADKMERSPWYRVQPRPHLVKTAPRELVLKVLASLPGRKGSVSQVANKIYGKDAPQKAWAISAWFAYLVAEGLLFRRGHHEWGLERPDAPYQSIPEDILATLKATGREMHITELVQKIHGSELSIRGALRRMAVCGTLTRVRRAVYALPEWHVVQWITKRAALKAALTRARAPMRFSALEAIAGPPIGTALRRLLSAREIRKIGRGLYVATSRAAALPSGSRSESTGGVIASEPLDPSVLAAEREKLIAIAIANGQPLAETLGTVDEGKGGGRPSLSSSVTELPPPPEIPDPRIDAPGGRQMLLLQKWGASSAQAQHLITRLIEAAGPDRRSHIDELFTIVERWPNSGRTRIAWLQTKADKMAQLPRYRVARRASRVAPGRDAIIAAVKAAPRRRASVSELSAKTGKGPDAIYASTGWMVKHQELLRLEPGVFGLPSTTSDYVGARNAIRTAMIGAPDRVRSIPDLMKVTGQTRTAIYAALFRMMGKGELVRAGRGIYALPAGVARHAAGS
jgi:hypothetical protein